MRGWLAPLLAGLLALAGCGYHLAGHGEGEWLAPYAPVRVAGNDAAAAAAIADRLQAAGIEVAEGKDRPARSMLRVELAAPSFAPSAFDANGIAVQYRMRITGSLKLEPLEAAKELAPWQSGSLIEEGEVYVAGGAAGTEASKRELAERLRATWIERALGRLFSGF